MTPEERLDRIADISRQIADLEKRKQELTDQLNQEIHQAFPENRGEVGKPPHGFIGKLVKASGKSRTHIDDVREGKYLKTPSGQ
ncbi:hypothetical protein [Nocardiopsis synnemataformans]|uniref:hypothetical protein n=1 Tax=Nocardiopsis synnemataformans TaxID=61305 RepID=UPI003EBF7CA8